MLYDGVCFIVCLSFGLSVWSWITLKDEKQTVAKFSGEVDRGPRRNWSGFGGNSESFVDSGPQFIIFFHYEIAHEVTICTVSQRVVDGFW